MQLFSAVNVLNRKKYSSDVLITVLGSFPRCGVILDCRT